MLNAELVPAIVFIIVCFIIHNYYYKNTEHFAPFNDHYNNHPNLNIKQLSSEDVLKIRNNGHLPPMSFYKGLMKHDVAHEYNGCNYNAVHPTTTSSKKQPMDKYVKFEKDDAHRFNGVNYA
jgi:hypothetical protein